MAEHPVSLIDLYPTLIDLCGIEGDTRKNDQGAKLDGHSVRPFLENPASRTWDGPEGALSMIYVGDSKKTYSADEKNDVANQHWSYRTERWRYIRYNDGVEELYDHQNDPHEWDNLADSPEHKAIKDKLKKEMFERIGPMKKFPVAGAKPEKKWDWFGNIDRNKDKRVTEAEWVNWTIQSAKKKGQASDAKWVYDEFQTRDKDENGFLTRKEFETKQ